MQEAATDQRIEDRRAFGPAFRAGEQPIFPSDDGLAQQKLGKVVVQGQFAVLEEFPKPRFLVQTVAKGRGQRRFGTYRRRDAPHPGKEPVDQTLRMLLPQLQHLLGFATGELPLQHEQILEGAEGQLGFGRMVRKRIMEIGAEMRPASASLQPIRLGRRIKLAAPIDQQQLPGEPVQRSHRMFSLFGRTKSVDRLLLIGVDPQPTAAQRSVAAILDGMTGIIGEQHGRLGDVVPDGLGDGTGQPGGGPNPSGYRVRRDVHALPTHATGLPVQGKVVGKLIDEDAGQQSIAAQGAGQGVVMRHAQHAFLRDTASMHICLESPRE